MQQRRWVVQMIGHQIGPAVTIEAALDPVETDYIFFVADGTGGHAFAVTLEEHNANVARWRQIEAERANQ